MGVDIQLKMWYYRAIVFEQQVLLSFYPLTPSAFNS
jgi:hypothetical protein